MTASDNTLSDKVSAIAGVIMMCVIAVTGTLLAAALVAAAATKLFSYASCEIDPASERCVVIEKRNQSSRGSPPFW